MTQSQRPSSNPGRAILDGLFRPFVSPPACAVTDPAPASEGPPRVWQRWLLTPVLSGGAVLLGVLVFISLASLKEPPPQTQPAQRVFRVPVFKVERNNIRPLLSTFGTARAVQEATIAAEVAGRIVAAPRAEVGIAVRGGPEPAGGEGAGPEIIVQIDPQTYQQRLLQAEALLVQDAAELGKLDQDVKNARRLLAQKQQSLASAKAQWSLQDRLVKEGAGRETELRRAELEYQQVEAAALQLQSELDLEAARRQQLVARQAAHQQDLELARLDLARANVTAPFSGIVSAAFVEAGQYVRAGDSLVKLTNIDRVEIPLALPISRSGPIAELLEAGRQPRVQLADHEAAECRWVGRVTRIAPVASESTRTVDVYAEVDNPPGRDELRPGTFVHARIESGEVADVTLVPRGAVIDGAVFVATAVDGSANQAVAARRPVTIASTLHTFAVVTAGVSPGDRVVLTNLDVLIDGSRLAVIEERDVRSALEEETLPALEIVENGDIADLPLERAAAPRE